MKVVTDGVEIIIATPGRLNDLIEAGCIKVESVTYLVLDEVSSCLLIGFGTDKMFVIWSQFCYRLLIIINDDWSSLT